MITAGATVLVAGLLFGAAYAGARPFRMGRASRLLRVTVGRAVGVAAVRKPANRDVVSHDARRRADRYKARHGNSGAATYGRRLREAVPNGIHRSGTPWNRLNQQRKQFAAAIRGGAR